MILGSVKITHKIVYQLTLIPLFVALLLSTFSISADVLPCPEGSFYEIPSYDVTYDLIRKGKKVGSARRTLKPVKENHWQLSMNSKASVLVVSFEYKQQSAFTWVDNSPRPDSYLQKDKNSLKSAKAYKQNFNWQEMTETGSYKKKKWQLPLKAGIQDRQTSILSLRQDLLQQRSHETYKYPVSYKGKINDDVYVLIGEESQQTPAGTFNTLKFERTHKNAQRVSYFWLAKELDYLPVRIRQTKEGQEQADMLLSSIN
ncbi:MAG: DUF3108 domain-containing protein [Gammaproteobacteria bacterium]|nr:DUF3108 domain-containing protein [Gammaproteobacteria bacterium]